MEFISAALSSLVQQTCQRVGWLVLFVLNLPIQTTGQFVVGVIVPIPPHTPNFLSKSQSK